MTKKKPVRRKGTPAPRARESKQKPKPKRTPLKLVPAVAFIVLAAAAVLTVILIVVSPLPAPMTVPETKVELTDNHPLLEDYRRQLNEYLSVLTPLFGDKEFKGRAAADRLIAEYEKAARELLEADIILLRRAETVPGIAAFRISRDLPLDDEAVRREIDTLGPADPDLDRYRGLRREQIGLEARRLAGRLSTADAEKLAARRAEADGLERSLAERRPAGDDRRSK